LEHLITLQYSLDLYRHYQKKIGELDQEMEAFMSGLPGSALFEVTAHIVLTEVGPDFRVWQCIGILQVG